MRLPFATQDSFGVLLFLYTVIASRGPDTIEADQGIEREALVSLPFGHAKYVCMQRGSHVLPLYLVRSQSLVNLLLTGCAVQNVWDGVQSAGGLGERIDP